MNKVKEVWAELPAEKKSFILQKYGIAKPPRIWERALTARMHEQFPFMGEKQVTTAVEHLWHNELLPSKREEILLKVAELEKKGAHYSHWEGEEHPAYETHPKQSPDAGAPKAKEEQIDLKGREKYDLTGKAREEATPGSKDAEKYLREEFKGEEHPGKPPYKYLSAEQKKQADTNTSSTVKGYPSEGSEAKVKVEEMPPSALRESDKQAGGAQAKEYKGEDHKLAAEGRERYDVSEKTKVAENKEVKAVAEGEAKTDAYKPSQGGGQGDVLQHTPIDPVAGKYDGDEMRRPTWMSEHLDEIMGHMKGRYEYSKNVPFEAPEWSKHTTLPTQTKEASKKETTSKDTQSEDVKKKIADASVKKATWGSPQNQLPFEEMRGITERQHTLVQNVGLHDKETRDVYFPDETGGVSHMPGSAGAPRGIEYQTALDPNWYAEEIFQGLRRRSYLTAQDGFEGMMLHEQARGLNEKQKIQIAEILRQWGFNVKYEGLKKPAASTPIIAA
jgi:hypothetical protein